MMSTDNCKPKTKIRVGQNTSHAVMAQRVEPPDSLDDFPTPPWATRALVENVIRAGDEAATLTVLEPACGRGYMSLVLGEYFGVVESSDIHDYGFARTADFLKPFNTAGSFDWVITNPPFRLAEDFINQARSVARRGVAMLVRTAFLESISRYERLFAVAPPAVVAQFSERVPMVKGRVDRKATTATSYAWIVWMPSKGDGSRLLWIPPCRKALERDSDYCPDGFRRAPPPSQPPGDAPNSSSAARTTRAG